VSLVDSSSFIGLSSFLLVFVPPVIVLRVVSRMSQLRVPVVVLFVRIVVCRFWCRRNQM